MKSKRKKSGGLRHSVNRTDKKLAWKGGTPTHTTIAISDKAISNEVSRVKGGVRKVRSKNALSVVVSVKNKAKKGKIVSVVENKGNRQYARRNIITKGAILKVEVDGKEEFVKVTNRPGQSDAVFGVITDWKPEVEKAKKARAPSPEKTEKVEKANIGKSGKAGTEKAEKQHKKAK